MRCSLGSIAMTRAKVQSRSRERESRRLACRLQVPDFVAPIQVASALGAALFRAVPI